MEKGDESKFQLFQVNKNQWCKKRKQIPVPKYVPSINVWGAFSINATFPLELINSTINSKRYCDILKRKLLPTFPKGFIYLHVTNQNIQRIS